MPLSQKPINNRLGPLGENQLPMTQSVQRTFQARRMGKRQTAFHHIDIFINISRSRRIFRIAPGRELIPPHIANIVERIALLVAVT